MSNERDFKKEAAWKKKVYKRFEFFCRTDNGELENLQSVLQDNTFPTWVRSKIAEDLKKKKGDIHGRDDEQ